MSIQEVKTMIEKVGVDSPFVAHLSRFFFAVFEPWNVSDWRGVIQEYEALTDQECVAIRAVLGDEYLFSVLRVATTADGYVAPVVEGTYSPNVTADGRWHVFNNSKWEIVVDPDVLKDLERASAEIGSK